jgi:HD domain/TIR domain
MLAMAQARENRDPYSGNHCQRLAVLARALGERLSLPQEDQIALVYGGYLHNIGLISIPDHIVFKRTRLTDDEWKAIRNHTLFGAQLCSTVPAFERVLPIIRSHHEHWDGSGYPDGLSGEEIPLLARIFQGADLYDALRTARPYKPALSHQHAIEIIAAEGRRGWREPNIADLLADLPIAELSSEMAIMPGLVTEVRESGKNNVPSGPPIEFYSCFISHSSQDSTVARQINDSLRQHDIKSWYAPEDLKIGDRFRLKIDESIKLHDKLLLILSRSSIRSAWVESEVEAALEHERRRSQDLPENEGRSSTILFPISIDDSVFEASSGWVAEVRRTRHIGDFRNWQDPARYAIALKRLLRDLAADK